MPGPVKLSFSQIGEGAPLVLVHGFPLSRRIWRLVEPILNKSYHVILPDLRGFGESPIAPAIESINDMATDILELVDRLNLKEPTLMGHSMGGYVTLVAQNLAPARFCRLGFICSQARGDSPEARQARDALATKVARIGTQAIVDEMLPKFFSPQVPLEDDLVQEAKNIILASKPSSVIAALRAVAAREDFTSRLKSFPKTLVVTGVDDKLIPPARSEEMAAAMPGAQLVQLAGVGHMPMFEAPEKLAAAFVQFLQEPLN